VVHGGCCSWSSVSNSVLALQLVQCVKQCVVLALQLCHCVTERFILSFFVILRNLSTICIAAIQWKVVAVVMLRSEPITDVILPLSLPCSNNLQRGVGRGLVCYIINIKRHVPYAASFPLSLGKLARRMALLRALR